MEGCKLVSDLILPDMTSSSSWVVDGPGGAAIATAIAGVHARGGGGSDSPFRGWGARGSRTLAARRLVSPRQVVISLRAGTPPSEETWPPSNRAMMGLVQTGYRAGFAGVAPTLASMASKIDGVEMSQPNFVANHILAPSPRIFWNLYNFCDCTAYTGPIPS
jgi:hypothetical protein